MKPWSGLHKSIVILMTSSEVFEELELEVRTKTSMATESDKMSDDVASSYADREVGATDGTEEGTVDTPASANGEDVEEEMTTIEVLNIPNQSPHNIERALLKMRHDFKGSAQNGSSK
jgi:hypothetical protein